jgi:hypothetical protein
VRNLSYPETEGMNTLLMYLYRAHDLIDDMEKLASSQNSCVVVCISTVGMFFLLIKTLVSSTDTCILVWQ